MTSVSSRALVALLAVCLAPAALAVPIGVSGQCYDDPQNGGQDALGLDTDDPTDVTLLTGTGAAAALVALSSDQHCNHPDSCGASGCSGDERKDYLEAHAGPTQACYDGTVRADGGCPTAPNGP